MSTQTSSASLQVTIVSQGNISEQQSTTRGNNPPDDTADYHNNENTTTLELKPELQPEGSKILSDDGESEWEDVDSESEDSVTDSFKLRALLALIRIDVALFRILIQYPGYNYEDALVQLINEWGDSDRFGHGSFEYRVLVFKLWTEFPDWIQRRVHITEEAMEKSGLELISSRQLEQYEREGKVILNCTQQCLICIEEYKAEEEVRVMNCRHAFHRRCIDEWLETSCNNCPVCRSTGVDLLRRT